MPNMASPSSTSSPNAIHPHASSPPFALILHTLQRIQADLLELDTKWTSIWNDLEAQFVRLEMKQSHSNTTERKGWKNWIFMWIKWWIGFRMMHEGMKMVELFAQQFGLRNWALWILWIRNKLIGL